MQMAYNPLTDNVWCTTECRWGITYTTGIKHKSSISGDNFIWMAYAFIILYGIIPTSITGFFNLTKQI
ncbi:hypothetical protein EB001_05370 [bacterium]|nr:hypothetical protein [bacterium]